MKRVRITHLGSGIRLAEGPLGWGITSFEGNFHIAGKYLIGNGLKANYVPGICPYKFVYVWLDLVLPDGSKIRNLGWRYWLPNPLLPVIWFRAALPGNHPELLVERFETE